MARLVVGIVLAALVLSACTASSKTAAVISPSPTATIRLLTPLPSRATPPSQSHAATPARASGTRVTMPWPSPPTMVRWDRSLALVHMAGSSATVVRDVTDINSPSTLATVDVPDWYWDPRGTLAFVGPADVGAIRNLGDGTSQLALIHYPGQPQPLIEAYGYQVAEFAWSPDGSSVAYLVDTWSTQRWEWHVASNGVDRFVAYTPGLCHCGEGIIDLGPGIWLDYSQDGRYMSFVGTNGFSQFLQIRTADGALVTSIDNGNSPSNYLTMPVWSGNKLYFRDVNGVEVWDNGAVRPFLPGVAWAYPRSSPAGGLIAYSAPDSSGVPHAFTVETATGKVRQLAARGSNQVHFLTDRYVWYRGAIHCPASEYCYSRIPGQGYKDTGATYIFDLTSGAEYVSRLSGVADTWPHGQ